MPVIRIKVGGAYKYQASVQNKRRGIPRTKRTFNTRKEANEWIAAVEADAHNGLLGRQRHHLFGEALAKYLREESPKKRSKRDDTYNANALRWPIWDYDKRRWLRLELLPLDKVPAAMSTWAADMRGVVRRGYAGSKVYQLRETDGRETWWYQPDPTEGESPKERTRVQDPALIAQLNADPGRGPYSSSTLRIRQSLVKTILRHAWKYWSEPGDVWLTNDISGRVDLDPAAKPLIEFLNDDELLALLIAADVHFDDAILGAAWIGWRKGNVVGSKYKAKDIEIEGLTWPRVVFPERDAQGRVIKAGYLVSSDTKNEDIVTQPMSDRVEQLLRYRLEYQCGPLVFHRGNGAPWGNFKRRWATTKRNAGVSIRWHGLRHSWASEMARHNVRDGQLQELGGWRDRKMVAVYTHNDREHLLDAVNLNKRKT